MFLKVGVLKNFAIFTEKNLRWSLYLINLQAWSPVIEWFHKVARFIKRSKKSWIEPKYWIWTIIFIHNFHQQKKFWNHLLDFTLWMAGQKSFHHVYLSCPGWKNLHRKAGQKSFRLVFIPSRPSYKQLRTSTPPIAELFFSL